MTTPTLMSDELIGIGNDIIEIPRIRDSLAEHGDRFLEKLLTPQERAYCASHVDLATHVAGRFCAKEAIAKALGLGFGAHLTMHDIEIINNSLGQPEVKLVRPNHVGILLSISHCRDYASAVAIAFKKWRRGGGNLR